MKKASSPPKLLTFCQILYQTIPTLHHKKTKSTLCTQKPRGIKKPPADEGGVAEGDGGIPRHGNRNPPVMASPRQPPLTRGPQVNARLRMNGEHAPFKAPFAQRGVAERQRGRGDRGKHEPDDPSVSFADSSLCAREPLVAHDARAAITHSPAPPSDEGGVAAGDEGRDSNSSSLKC